MSAAPRPHCLQPTACRAKGVGHCCACQAKTPETRARKSAAAQRVIADPEKLARKQAAARRVSADPEIAVRRTAAMLATLARPEVKARQKAACKAGAARRMANPVQAETLRQCGRTVGRANLAAAKSPEALARRAATIRAKHLAWCPPEHWALNAKLKANGYRLAERQRVIAELVEHQSAEAAVQREARNGIAKIDAQMRARRERELAQAY